MTEQEFNRKQEELDRQLNDPAVAMDPDKIWALLAELAPSSSTSVSTEYKAA